MPKGLDSRVFAAVRAMRGAWREVRVSSAQRKSSSISGSVQIIWSQGSTFLELNFESLWPLSVRFVGVASEDRAFSHNEEKVGCNVLSQAVARHRLRDCGVLCRLTVTLSRRTVSRMMPKRPGKVRALFLSQGLDLVLLLLSGLSGKIQALLL
jgi:hypothetical protein